MAPPHKRPKRDGEDSESKESSIPGGTNESPPETLEKAFELMTRGSTTIYGSMTAYLEAVDKDQEDVTELFAAQYFKDGSLENKYSVPPEFRKLVVARSKRGEVISIADSVAEINSEELLKVLTVGGMMAMGFKTVILGESNDNYVEAIGIPGGVYVEALDEPVKKQKDHHGEARVVVTRKSRTVVYAPESDIHETLELGYVTLAGQRNLLSALNSMANKEDLSDWDASVYVDTDALAQAMKREEQKDAAKSFYAALYAMKIDTMTGDERTRFFAENASFRLAHSLQIRLPHRGPVYSKINNKKIESVSITDLDDDDQVLLNTNIISQKEYANLIGDVADLQVLKYTADVGVKKGNNKWSEITARFTENAGTLKALLSSITKANNDAEKIGDSKLTTQPAKKKTVSMNF
jgi:hypothetical protein